MFSPRRVNPNIEEKVLVTRHSKARRIKPLREVKPGAIVKGRPTPTRFGYKSGAREYTFFTDGSVRRTDAGAGVRGKAAKKRAKRHGGAQQP